MTILNSVSQTKRRPVANAYYSLWRISSQYLQLHHKIFVLYDESPESIHGLNNFLVLIDIFDSQINK